MKTSFTIPRHIILEALTITGKATTSRAIIPILDCYLFTISDSNLYITASNGEIKITTKIAIAADGEDICLAIPSGQLIGLVKELPELPIQFNIAIDGKAIIAKITAGKGNYKITCEDGKDYPQMKHDGRDRITVESNILKTGIEKTIFAVETSTAKPEITGILLQVGNGRLKFVAANMKGLAIYTLPGPEKKIGNFIVPAKTMQIVNSLPHDKLVEISASERSINFKINEDTELMSVLIDGKFPDFERVIPDDNTYQLMANRQELIKAIKRVNQFANQTSNHIKLSLTEKSVKIIGEDGDYGTAADEEIAFEYIGDPIDYSTSGKTMIDYLSKLTSENIFLYFGSPQKLVIIREEIAKPSSKDNLVATTPMRVTNGKL
jgi:DNA polymerase III subunit beta